MPIRVQVPGHGVVEFPDGTSQNDMRAAIEHLSGTPQRPGALARFSEPILSMPGQALDFAGNVGMSLIPGQYGAEARQAVGRSLVDPSVDQLNQARAAFLEGRPGASLGHIAAGAVPVIGPSVAQGVEQMRSGDVAGGIGTEIATALPFVAGPIARGTARGGAALLRNAGVAEPLAAWADRSAVTKLTDVAGPKTGPKKANLTEDLANIAPTLLRDPELNAFTRGGLHTKIEGRLADAEAGLDAAADARLNARSFDTNAIVTALMERRNRLTARAVEGSQFTPQSGVNRPPIGQDVVPGPNQSQVAIIDKAIGELRELGPVARYESLRRIREAYDKPAKAIYSSVVTDDFAAKQGEKLGAADVTGALREKLATFDPETAKANVSYSLFRTADDVITAAEQADRARPNRGSRIAREATGAIVGGMKGGVSGAAIGRTVGAMVDAASQMAPTFQIMIARRLAGVADMLRNGDIEAATATVDRTVRSFPAVKTGLKVSGQLAPTAGRLGLSLPRAAGGSPSTSPEGQ